MALYIRAKLAYNSPTKQARKEVHMYTDHESDSFIESELETEDQLGRPTRFVKVVDLAPGQVMRPGTGQEATVTRVTSTSLAQPYGTSEIHFHYTYGGGEGMVIARWTETIEILGGRK